MIARALKFRAAKVDDRGMLSRRWAAWSVAAAIATAVAVGTTGLGASAGAGSQVGRTAPSPVVAFATLLPSDDVPPAPDEVVPDPPAAPPAEAPAAQAPAVVEPPPQAPAPAPSPCAAALDWVAGAGLALPAGVDYRCPASQFAHQGAACWYSAACPGQAFIAVNMDMLVGASPAYLRHVVAHEVCHILEWRSRGWTTEASADACAAAHGAPA